MKEYLFVLVLFICFSFHLINECPPVLFSQKLKKPIKIFSALVHIHFSVQCTKISTKSLSRLPAFRVLTFVNPHHVGFILPEIETFSGVNLMTHGFMKIVVANLTITVNVKFVENKLELLLSQVQAPIFEVEPELFL
jgi:hypothetical protein